MSSPPSSGFPSLPPGFLLGASTAAYQIEGAAHEDGKGPSIWDTFCAEPGRIADGSSGEVACDHYHRVLEDVALMGDLGLDAYRFSISWPRVQPTGAGAANPAGLDFYDRLVDALLAAGVEPMATLYHWDLPQALQDEGGWQARGTAERFADYARRCGDRLGDRVGKWAPVNEPNVVTLLGHGSGEHAPGLRVGEGVFTVAHHLNLAHGLAVQALRAAGARAVGTATNHALVRPATDRPADVAAAEGFDLLWNRIFAEPVLLGAYPEECDGLVPLRSGDLRTIAQPLDHYGFNYYSPLCVGAGPEGSEVPFERADLTGYPTTDFGWPIVPSGLRDVIDRLRALTPELPPLYVTENGASYAVGPDQTGVVDDEARIDYLDAHLRVLAEAVADGADVRGYYCWSLLDNFEWAEGYAQRFGLVHVDYDTLVRTPKRSAQWYAALIRDHHARA